MSEVEAGMVVGRFFCPGRARTKGSMRPQPGYGKGGRKVIHMVESGEHSVPWKNAMITAVRRQCAMVLGEPYAEPVSVEAVFLFERERGVNGELLESHDSALPTAMSIGDLDKLLRNLLDALTQSGMILDDRLVARITSGKRWCLPGEKPGVDVTVTAL